MSDSILASGRVSSLFSALAAGPVKKDDYVLAMAASSVPSAREYLKLSPDNSASIEGGEINFVIPKSGFVQQACLSFQLQGMSVTGYSGTKGFNFAAMLSCAMVERIDLRTNSRVLMSLDSYRLARLINDSPNSKMYKRVGGWDWNEHSMPTDHAGDLLGFNTRTGSQGPTVHLPLLFAPFLGNSSSCLPAAFCETVSLVVKLRPMKFWCIPTANATAPTKILAQLSIANQVLEHNFYKQTIAKTFTPGGSAQILFETSNLIAKSALILPGQTILSEQTCPLTSNCTDLVRSFLVVCVPESHITGKAHGTTTDAVMTSDMHQVFNVKFNASGREIFKLSREVSNVFRKLHGGRDVSSYNDIAISSSFMIDFCDDPLNPSNFSGGIPMAGLSSQQWEIGIRSRTNTSYYVHVYACSVGVRSITSDSGSIVLSLST